MQTGPPTVGSGLGQGGRAALPRELGSIVRHLTINGIDLAIWDDFAVEISGTSVVRVALVSDSVEELLGDEAYIEVMAAVTASVRRRALIPQGFWVLGANRVDDLDWQNGLDPMVAGQAEQQRKKINGHVRVYSLFDSHDIQTPV